MTDRSFKSIFLDDDHFAMVSGIVGTIAHDFNNLLTPFLAYPQMIKRDLPEDAGGHDLLDVMEKTAKDMVHLNQQLLDFAWNGSGDRKPLDMNKIAADVLSQLECDELLPAGFSVHVELAPDIWNTTGVANLLAKAVYNICCNAVEATAKTGNLSVRTDNVHVEEGVSAAGMCHGGGEYVRFTVTDSGSGIAAEVKDRIFNPFFTTKKGGPRRGAGLGLSVAYRIIINHKGFIDFESEPGKGTSFSIYLPAAGRAAPAGTIVIPADATQAASAYSVACDTNRVLLVDDEKSIVKLFQMILSSALPGLEIDLAYNGEEAIKSFTEKHQRVLIMDLYMPVMDGQAAFFKLESLCKENNWEMPSVVFCTGFAPSDSIRSVISGATSKHCLLCKPVGGNAVVEAVKSRLGK